MGGDTSAFRVYYPKVNSPETATAELERLVVRLQDEMDKLIKMYAFQREALENEMVSGMGYKKMGTDDKFLKKLKELTIGMNNLVETKIKYDKAQKSLTASMTPAEELEAVFKFIMSLDYETRNGLRRRLSDNGVWKWKEDGREGPSKES